MSMDIVSRLRCVLKGDKTAQAGADEIERLRAEIERLNSCLRYEQHRADRVVTHGPGCETWGPAHYECVVLELAASREREARMRDALDHIARVSMGGRTKSKRNEWIAQRAKSALNGDDDWMRLEKPHGYHRALEGAPVAALAEGAQG